jgi:hypothetical protein
VGFVLSLFLIAVSTDMIVPCAVSLGFVLFSSLFVMNLDKLEVYFFCEHEFSLLYTECLFGIGT